MRSTGTASSSCDFTAGVCRPRPQTAGAAEDYHASLEWARRPAFKRPRSDNGEPSGASCDFDRMRLSITSDVKVYCDSDDGDSEVVILDNRPRSAPTLRTLSPSRRRKGFRPTSGHGVRPRISHTKRVESEDMHSDLGSSRPSTSDSAVSTMQRDDHLVLVECGSDDIYSAN